MAYIPQLNNYLRERFSKTPKTFSEFNYIFFDGKCRFFGEIETNYQKEGNEFLKIYKNLSELVLNME